MRNRFSSLALLMALLGSGSSVLPALAQQGVTATRIMIGASLPLSGDNFAAGAEGFEGAKAYIDYINANGGVHGRRIEFIVLDDAFDPATGAGNARQLIEEHKVFALFNCWGIGTCNAIAPVSALAQVPLIAGLAGGGDMRRVNRYIFNLRAPLGAEIEKMAEHLATNGMSRVGVVHQGDDLSKNALALAESALARRKLRAVAIVGVKGDGSDAANIARVLTKAVPDAVMVLTAPPAALAVIQETRKAGYTAPFFNLAEQASQTFVRRLGEHGAGTIYSTLTPNPWRDEIPVVKEYQKLLAAATGKKEYSFLSLETFLNAKVLVEGLRKAGKDLTREKLIGALEGMTDADLGGFWVRYSPSSHDGSRYVGLTILSKQGRFLE